MSYYLRVFQSNRMRDICLGQTEDLSCLCADRLTRPMLVRTEQGYMLHSRGGEQKIREGDCFQLGSDILCLLVWEEHTPLASLLLEGLDEVYIGREGDCGLRLPSREIPASDLTLTSRRHALLRRTIDGWYISPIKQEAAVYLNGSQLQSRDRLADGDSICLGKYTITFNDGRLCAEAVPYLGLHTESRVEQKSGHSQREEHQPPSFNRSPHIRTKMPTHELRIPQMEHIGSKPEINWLTTLLPPALMAMITGVSAVFLGRSSMLIMLPMTCMSAVVAILNYRAQKKKFFRRSEEVQQNYNAALAEEQKIIDDVKQRSLRILQGEFPAPETCARAIEQLEPTLWRVRPDEESFLELRLGTGTVPSPITIRPGAGTPSKEVQELCAQAARLHDAPVTIPLMEYPVVGIAGDPVPMRNALRSIVMQTATNHSYEEVKIIAFLSQEELNQWDWLRWLPHAQDNGRQQRYLAADQKSITQLCMEFEEILNARLSPVKKAGGSTQAHLLFLVGDTDLIARQTLMSILLTADPALHSTVIFTSRSKGQLPSGCTAIIETDGGEECWYPTQDSSDTHTYRADTWQLDSCARLARRMAAVRLAEGAAARELPRSVTFLEGYGVHRVEELHIENRWKKEGVEKTLAVPVAVRENGETFRFDIHETAHGPHGMVSGSSGSGKSEMVQSWILAMALQYPPDLVAFVIVDFKGDGLLAPFRKLPHLAGTISNLDHNAQRNGVALEAEIVHRQELLARTGAHDATDYIAKYRHGEVDEPMPNLILVVDEFAEVRTLHPEFVPIVDRVYTVGRSLGVHIVTLAQDMASAGTDKIKANSNFRWCLQVMTPDSSREMLGTADAFTMPKNPGRGYVKVGDFEVYEKVQSFWSSAPYDPDHHSEQDAQPQISKVELGGERTALTGQVKQNNKAARETEISAVIRYICDYAERNGIPRPRQLWQAAIGRELVLEDIEPEDDGGARYVFTVGLVDNPAEQAQYPLSFQLEQCGSVALNGGPETGKTTFLITAILSLARRYSPDELELYLFDYDKDALNLFRNLPHTKGCTAGAGPEEIRAIVGAVQREIDRRKKLFLDAGVFSMEAYAARVRALPAVVMVVDNICNAWDDNSQMQDLLYAVAQKGAGYGIWMVVTAPGASFPFKIQNLFKTRLSLCQNDRGSFTDIVGRVEIMPESYPGRGLVRRGTALEFQTALPVPGNSAERELVLSEEVQDMREEWKNYAASRQQTAMAELRDSLVGNLFLGVTKDDQQPVLFENSGKHFMLVSCDSADVRRSLIANYAAQCTKMDAELVLFDDPDGTLADVSASHCFKHADPAGDTYIAELMEVLNERQEQREVDPNVELPRLILLIAEIRSFFGAAEDDTIRDLRDIVELGSGLGITLLVAGSRMGLRELSGDRLGVAMLREGHVLFVGGALKEHAAQDTVRSMAWTEQERKLDDSEAWYVLDDTVRLLQIRSEGMKKYNE